MASSGNVVLSYGDSLIRESEMVILKKQQWLNDVIIGFYFEYLSTDLKAGDYGVTLYPPGLCQFLKITSGAQEISALLGDQNLETVQYAMWAVNDSSETETGASGTHWSLLVFSRPDNKFLHYDSWAGANEKYASLLFRNLRPCFSPSSSYHSVTNCTSQANGRDCGLHVIMNAQIILDFIKSQAKHGQKSPKLWSTKGEFATATPEQATLLRERIISLITKLKSDV